MRRNNTPERGNLSATAKSSPNEGVRRSQQMQPVALNQSGSVTSVTPQTRPITRESTTNSDVIGSVNSSMFPPLVLEPHTSPANSKANLSSNTTASINHDLLGTLHNFYKQDQLTDAEIHIGGITIRAHRVVLAAASDYFRAMFSLNMAERSNGVVVLHDVDPLAVQTLVDFAYVQELKPALTTENVQPLLYAASILQFNKVLSLCCSFIADNLDPSHALPLLPLAEHFGLLELLTAVRSYVARNFHETILGGATSLETSDLSEDVLRMSESDLLAIFTDKELVVRNESALLEVLLKWAEYSDEDTTDENSRTEAARRIFTEGIKVAYLPLETIYRLLRTEPITCNADCTIRALVEDALVCRLIDDDDQRVSGLLGAARAAELRNPRRCSSGALVCVGGRQASTEPFRSAEIYDWTTDRWLKIPDMNARRRHVGVAVCSSQGKRGLYAVGGHDGSRHLDSVELLPLEPGGKWRTVASLHTLRRGLAVTSVNVDCSTNLLFAIGGLDDQSCFPHVEIYDPNLDAWSFGPPMSQSRGGVACAAICTRIFAVGGNDGSYSVDSGEVLDPIVGRWVPIARMRHRRAGAGLSVVNGCLWVAGGFDENVPLNAVEYFDPRIGAWMKGPNMRTARGGVGLATMGSYLFAVGGHDGSDYLQSVECFDPRMFVTSGSLSPGSAYTSNSSEWDFVASLGSGRAGAGVVHVPDVLPSVDLPIISTSVNSNRPVADCV